MNVEPSYRSSSPSLNLEEVQSHFEAWRASCQGQRQKIPEGLWQEAVSLLSSYPLTTVCHRLRLCSGSLKSKQRAFQSASPVEPSSQTPNPLSFLSIDLPSPPSEAPVFKVEFLKPDGHRMQVEGVGEACLSAWITHFFSGGR